jgi:site-specific DNA-methyltransferase (adenine-specific)
MKNFELWQGNCLELMKDIPDGSVDAVICDPPYGTTACKWDSIIPFHEMWEELNRITKEKAVIALFGTEPFSSFLRISNINKYKYDWVWHKSKCGSAFTSKYRPQQKHEYIHIFSNPNAKYYPQMREGEPYSRKRKANKGDKPNNHNLGVIYDSATVNTGYRYPETVIFFQQKWRRQDQVHPTQKPVELMEYLIKTYTQEKETVLDFTMGSGTTGVACGNTNRNFIGIELDEGYFGIAKNRIEDAYKDYDMPRKEQQC